jgi:hypothetical protein
MVIARTTDRGPMGTKCLETACTTLGEITTTFTEKIGTARQTEAGRRGKRWRRGVRCEKREFNSSITKGDEKGKKLYSKKTN